MRNYKETLNHLLALPDQVSRLARLVVEVRDAVNWLDSHVKKALPPDRRMALVWGRGLMLNQARSPYSINHDAVVELPLAFKPEYLTKGETKFLSLRTQVPVKLKELHINEPFVMRGLRVGNRYQEAGMEGGSLTTFAHDVLTPGDVAQIEVHWP